MRKGYLGLLVFVLCFVVVGLAAPQTPSADWPKSKHANRELAADDAATWEVQSRDTQACLLRPGTP